MKELQRAAKLLNANAPVDGPFGKERIVYVNPFEERILKELGGSGEIIIPEEGTPSYSQYKGPTQSRVLPEGYEGVTSFRVPIPNVTPKKSYNWLETVMDDWLGFDDTKWLGIKKDTFIGKGLKKVGDDILGIDGKKTLGIKNSTLGDIAKFVAPFFGPAGWAAWAGMNAIEINEALEDAGKFKDDLVKFGDDFKTNYDPRNYIGLRYSNFSDALPGVRNKGQDEGEPRLTKEERAKARGGSANMENIQNRINAVPSYSLTLNDADTATNKAIVTAQQGAGKAPIFNPADTDKVNSFFAEPGDENYIEDFSKGGTYNDPYPDYMKEAGDTIISEIDEAGKFFKDYQGTSDQRMYDFQPIVDKLKGMNLDLINTTGQIFDQGEGGLESKLRGFNSKQDNLANQLKELNTLTGQDNQRNLDNYVNNLKNSVDTQVDLTNLGYDAQRTGAMAKNRQAMNLANAGLRNLNSLSASGTGQSMANAMIGARLGQEMSDNIAGVEADRYARLAEINPAMGDLLSSQARMKYGDQNLAAASTNIGVDQAMIDDDKALENEILNARLGNAGMIDYLGNQAASLPGLQLKAALDPLNTLMQYTAPYSDMNSLPAPIQGYSPAPAGSNDLEWYDYLNMAPELLNSVSSGLDAGGDLLDRLGDL
jgi:hypothetical protein